MGIMSTICIFGLGIPYSNSSSIALWSLESSKSKFKSMNRVVVLVCR
jgi:hypothetical protein